MATHATIRIACLSLFVVLLTLGAGNVTAAEFAVDSAGDGADVTPGDGLCADAAGTCSLRAAIEESNALPGPDVVRFAIGSGPQTLSPGASLPTILDAVTIDATTQPGYAGVPLIRIDGAYQPPLQIGFHVFAGPTTIRGFVITRFMFVGIVCHFETSDITIADNYIGTDGTEAFPNGEHGVFTDAPNTRIENNVIAGHSIAEVAASGTNTIIRGNRIGTDAAGLRQLGLESSAGVQVRYRHPGPVNQIGGESAADRNVIGTRGSGVVLFGFNATSHVIGNYIGVGADGITPLPMDGAGVGIFSGSFHVVGNNVIGWSAGVQIQREPGSFRTPILNVLHRNRIGVAADGITPAGNHGPGIRVQGAGTTVTENTIAFNRDQGVLAPQFLPILRGNSIVANGLLGIDNGASGPSPIGAPVLTLAQSAGGTTTVQGTLDFAAMRTFTLEFFLNEGCDPSGFGEGQIPIGTTTVTTNSAGHADFTATFPVAVTSPMTMTATSSDSQVFTSEFSACRTVILNRPPMARCHDVTASASRACDAMVTAAEVNNGSFDPDGDVLAFTLSPAGPYPVGTTSVQLIANDGNGGTATCTATVTVVDDTSPVITCPPDIEQRLEYGQSSTAVSYATPPASDNCAVTVISCDHPSGSQFDAGTTLVTCTAIDADGNVGSCTFNVTLLTAAAATQDLAAAVSALVAQGTLSSGNANSLAAKLDAALQKLADGKPETAAHQLEAFIAQVEALVRSRHLPAEEGERLIAAARAVLAQIT